MHKITIFTLLKNQIYYRLEYLIYAKNNKNYILRNCKKSNSKILIFKICLIILIVEEYILDTFKSIQILIKIRYLIHKLIT